MKRIIKIIVIIAIIALGVGYIIAKKNNTSLSIDTIDLEANCSSVENLAITSVVTVSVKNHSSRTHSNVTVKLTAEDKNGAVIKEKYVTFDRTLPPEESLSKPVTLPAKARFCNCVVESSTPHD